MDNQIDELTGFDPSDYAFARYGPSGVSDKYSAQSGLSKREYIAITAMSAYIISFGRNQPLSYDDISNMSFAMADSLINIGNI